MDRTTSHALAEGARALGVDLDAQTLERFGRYLELLRRWNTHINLTRIVREDEIIAKHFLDSLALVPHLGAAETLIDVGSGAGFPGVPCALARPGLRVTLVESIHKKCAFLEALKRELGLPLTVVSQRLEAYTAPSPFDVAVSRATFAPAEWAERGASLVGPGGLLVVMLGRERPEWPTLPDFLPPTLHDYTLPIEGTRALALFRSGAERADVPRGT